VCDQVFADFDACTHQSYNDYKTAYEAGDDGLPNWMARKSCNYMTAAVEECGNTLVGECVTEEEVTEMKDHQLKGILMQLQTSAEEWDSDKCPAVKDHIDRMKKKDDKSDSADGGEDNADEDGDDDDNQEDADEDADEGDKEEGQEVKVDEETEEESQEGEADDEDAAEDEDVDENGDDDEDADASASSMTVSLFLLLSLYVLA